MTGVVKEISAADVEGLLWAMPDARREISVATARATKHLWAGFWNDQLLCIFGLTPPTMLSTNAHLWLITTNEAKRHPIIFGRWARRMVNHMLDLYPTITGFCVNGIGLDWLASLNAELTYISPVLTSFEIKSWQAR